MVRKLFKRVLQGLPWWPNGQDSMLPMQGAQVQFLVRELDPKHTEVKILQVTTEKTSHAAMKTEDPMWGNWPGTAK